MGKPKTVRTPRVANMPEAEAIQARQAADSPADNRFHKVITLSASAEDWEAPEYDVMHAGNRLDVIQSALAAGLHPTEEARYDGAELVPGNRGRHTTRLSYSVAVRTADMANADTTVTPSKILRGA